MNKVNLPFDIVFNNANLDNKKFYILSFEGNEQMNDIYEYEVQVLCHDKVDLKEFLTSVNKSMYLKMHINKELRYIHGICTSASIENMINDLYIYRLKIVHPLGALDITKQSRVFLEMNIEEVISEILKENQFTKGEDYIFDLTSSYEEIDYLCQYKESNLKFIRRWIAEYGIRMHFEHDVNGSKIVFSDNNKTFKFTQRQELEFHPALNYKTDSYSAISFIENIQNRVPIKSLYKNNDLRYSEIPLNQDGIPDSLENTSSAEYYHFGGTPFIQKNHQRYSKVEDDRLRSNTTKIKVNSNYHSIAPGYLFKVKEHFYIEENSYLILKVNHKGNQLSYLKSLTEPIKQSLLGYNLSTEYTLYENSFEAIDNQIEYRQPRLPDKPMITGIIFAEIYSQNGAEQAYRGKDCTYQVKMPFDLVSNKNLYSCWIKTLGDSKNRGIQIVLQDGEAVAIAFIEGDVNRPYIAGAVEQRDSIIYDGLESKMNTGNYEEVIGYGVNGLFFETESLLKFN